MREIKFRAQAIVNSTMNNISIGDLVYGLFIQTDIDEPCIVFGDGEQIEIDVKTLGQLTGLKDKNGVEIYESDIVKTTYIKASPRIEVVTYDELRGFTPMHEPCDYDEIYLSMRDVEVIGNIHQDPELLK